MYQYSSRYQTSLYYSMYQDVIIRISSLVPRFAIIIDRYQSFSTKGRAYTIYLRDLIFFGFVKITKHFFPRWNLFGRICNRFRWWWWWWWLRLQQLNHPTRVTWPWPLQQKNRALNYALFGQGYERIKNESNLKHMFLFYFYNNF